MTKDISNSTVDKILIDNRDSEEILAPIRAARPDLACYQAAEIPEGLDLASACLITFDPSTDLERLRGIGWIHCSGAGVDKLFAKLNFDVPLITRTAGTMGAQMGEYVLAHMLAEAQKIAITAGFQAERRWNRPQALPSHLFDQKALVFGTGSIGGGIAARLLAMGMHVTGVSRSGRERHEFAEVVAQDALGALDVSQYRYLVMALPNTPEANGVVNGALLSRLSGAMLINVGRGNALNLDEVRAALNAGHVRRAVLDVFETEPLPPTSWLWDHPNVTVTPHVSGFTRPIDSAHAFLNELERLETGKPPLMPVDASRGY